MQDKNVLTKSLVAQLVGLFWCFQRRHPGVKSPQPQLSMCVCMCVCNVLTKDGDMYWGSEKEEQKLT